MIEDSYDGAGQPAAEDIVLAQAGADPELLEALSPPDGEEAGSRRARRSVQDRIDEVTRARREAEREADYWREVAYEAAAALEAAQGGEAASDGGPDPGDYVHGEDDADFIRDLVQHQMRKEYERQAHDFAMAHESHRLDGIFAQREQAAAERLPDYHALVHDGARCGAWPCSKEMADAIKTSEVGPELAYLMAHNPDEAQRISSLSHAAQIRELGRLEGLLMHRPALEPTGPKTATTAPEPPPVIRGGGGRFPVAPDTADFAAFDKQYG